MFDFRRNKNSINKSMNDLRRTGIGHSKHNLLKKVVILVFAFLVVVGMLNSYFADFILKATSDERDSILEEENILSEEQIDLEEENDEDMLKEAEEGMDNESDEEHVIELEDKKEGDDSASDDTDVAAADTDNDAAQSKTEDSEQGDESSENNTEELTDEGLEPEETVAMGAGVLVFEGVDYTVTVTDTDSVLPADTQLKVKEILPGTDEYKIYSKQAQDAVDTENGEEVGFARFFDISFVSGGAEIEPEGPVSVAITFNTKMQKELEVSDEESVKILHFEEDEKTGDIQTEVLDDKNVEVKVEKDKLEEAVFDAETFSVYGVISTITIDKYVLASDGHNYHISVSYGPESKIPRDAELSAEEILSGSDLYDLYVSKSEAALGLEKGSSEYIRLFDIKIVKDGVKLQPAEGTFVDVRIELADAESNSMSVVHFADKNDKGDVIDAETKKGTESFSGKTTGETVSFEAEGFSAYAIVEAPQAAAIGWHKITSVDDLISKGKNGLYICHIDGYYFGNTLVADNKRTGIAKIKPAVSSPPEDKASKYYFEPVQGQSEKVYVYCYAPDGVTKQYVFNRNNNSLSFTDENGRTAFNVTKNTNGSFMFNNGEWYWNMQGGASGARFCSYNSSNDPNNNIYLWYHSDVNEDPYDLDETSYGTSYGLMYWDDSLYGKALMSNTASGSSLEAKPLMVLATADNSKKLFVPNDSDITMWNFKWDNDDNYYLFAIVDGSTKYLKIDTNGLSLTGNPNEASLIQVIPGTGAHAGQICLKSGNTTLTYSGKETTGFNVNGEVGTEWLYMVNMSELTSDYFKTYSARKVSVSDKTITTGSKVIVYTRAWNEDALKYEYFAIDHDGKLVRVYESGDSIEWAGNVINTMLWQFTEYTEDDCKTPTYFYELYNEYAEKFLAPQITGGQIISGAPIGINMNGRRNGQYYSSILAWDEENYSYAGFKVEDGKIVSCPKAEAMDFYFAVLEDIPVDDELTTVSTVDNTQYGITMKIVDFNSKTISGTGATSTIEQHDVMGVTEFTKWQEQSGLLSTDLKNGYPTATLTGKSLSDLFKNAKDVNHIFIESTFKGTGYYEFDSAQNFASLDGNDSGDFKVYKELGTYDGADRETLKHGQFLPFNKIEAGRFASVNGKNLYSVDAKLLPDSDPRKYENLYLVNGSADLYFGVELAASFTQTPNGLDDWGHDIIFEFTGDDDFWLYVDGELVIDLGGIHSALPGSVNFRTGNVIINNKSYTLRDLFYDNYLKRDNHTPAEAQAYVDEIFIKNDAGQWVFKDYSTHTMNIFYMERGAGASNLHMRFNLASVKPGTVELSKELAGVDNSETTMAEFPYQIKYKKKNNGKEYYLTNSKAGTADADDHVFYKNTTNPVKYSESMVIGGITYQDVFILRPGETAVIEFPTFGSDKEEIESYSIVECGVNTEVYNSVKANGTEIEGTSVAGAENRKDYGIGYSSTADRPRVNYVNTVNPEALRTLTFSKKLFQPDGRTPISHSEDSTTFSFRLYFGTETDKDLSPANMYTYHVKDEQGNYCTWDKTKQLFVSTGKTDYTGLSDAEKAAVSFTTSMNGSISKIPVDYTVEVRQILAGTKYKVEERPNEMPDGYSFQQYEFYENYGTSTPVSSASAVAGVTGTIVTGKDPHVDICNLKGYGLRINKVWTDADYMQDRETTYFAVYTYDGIKPLSREHLTIVPETLRELPYGTTTLYWYWLILPVQDVAFDNYLVCEVKITKGKPSFNDEGIIDNQDELTIEPLVDNPAGEPKHNELKLNGTQKGETEPAEFTYTVRYERSGITEKSNVKVDKVINDRPGIILRKQDWSDNPLVSALFTLKDSNDDGIIGMFASDKDGYITTAFLGEGKEYKLNEISTPHGYTGISNPIGIKSEGGVVTVSGIDKEYYILSQANDTTPATLTLKNRPYEFIAVKKDGDTGKLLKGVHFALHKQVTVDGVISFDLRPMAGYADLVTDDNGVIPLLDNTLPSGTYQLREIQSLNGYKELPDHIDFSVSKLGEVTLRPSMDDADWVTLNPYISDESGLVTYEMTVLNYIDSQVTLRKVDASGNALTGAKFSLCKYTSSWEKYVQYKEIDMTESSEMQLTGLSAGRYRLEETTSPDGYLILEKYTYFNIAQDGTAYLTDENGTGDNSNEQASISHKDNVNVITVKNIPGAALPRTGGIGTRYFTIMGIIMITLAGIGLVLIRIKNSAL